MSLVFPHSLNSSMQSKESQADICDTGDVTDTLKSFQTQVQDLYTKAGALTEQLRSRGESISQLDAMLENLESGINEMMVTGKVLENVLQDGGPAEDESTKELDDLIAERDHLQSQLDQFQQHTTTTQSDVDNHQRLLGYLQEETYRKMEDLFYMKEKLSAAKHDYEKEWADFKTDLVQNRKERNAYQEDIDHVKDLTLARFIGMHTKAKADSSEKELISRICTYRTAERLHRQLQQDALDSEMKCKDLEDEIGGLLAMKKEYWKRCLDLENCLDELNGETEHDISLRPAAAHQDLTNLEGADWERQHEEDTEESVDLRLDFGYTGKILHRCPKQTNIAIGESLSDENESEAATTSVDAGALDSAVDELTAKNSGADSASPQADPEPEPETEQDDQNSQMQLPGKVLENLSPQAQTSNQPAAPKTFEEPETHTPFISKLRKRVSGLSGSMHRIRGQRLKATGSTKHIDATPKRGRR